MSVIGDARLASEEDVARALELGQALLAAGFRIVCGGMGGLMEEVARGARRAPTWIEGSIVGIVPSYRFEEANPWCDIVIPTGMQIARNVLVVASGDVVLAVGGGSGTLSEIAVAWQLGKPIVALGGTGWAGRVAGQLIDGRGREPVHAAADVAHAVSLCAELSARPATGGDIGSGWRRSE